jgi:O-6-methylguanine DNA methyltransferase
MTLYIDKVESDVWSGFLVVSEKGLCYVSHYTDDLSDVVAWQMKRYPESKLISDTEKVAPYRKQFEEYLQGVRFDFDLPVDLQGTDFQKSVWEAMRKIPYGQTASYLELAHHIGRDYKSTRAVGGAVGKNPLSVIYPCHRVVGQDGSLTGYSGGIENKISLLNHELEHAVEMKTSE